MRTPKVKICGMADAASLAAVCGLGPDYVGFVFYDRSPRCVRGRLSGEEAVANSGRVSRVGVFVDEDAGEIARAVEAFSLGAIQLHGEETPEECGSLGELLPGVAVWKAVPIGETLDVGRVRAFSEVADMLLFDTATGEGGGSGRTFDWKLLSGVAIESPFLVAGGLGVEEVPKIVSLLGGIPGFSGIDMNSRLELSPGIKDTGLVERAISEVRKCVTQ